jgi:hypothetical protein
MRSKYELEKLNGRDNFEVLGVTGRIEEVRLI